MEKEKNQDVAIEQKESLDDIKKELADLSELVIFQTIESLEKFFIKKQEQDYKKELDKAKFFKNWLVIKKFLNFMEENYSEIIKEKEYIDLYNYAKDFLTD